VLTPWGKLLVEKLLVAHPFKKIPRTFETPVFITMFTKPPNSHYPEPD
jgi:hypothetical protein